MTAQTATIADFLLARIAEDEAVARAVTSDLRRIGGDCGPHWHGEPSDWTGRLGRLYVGSGASVIETKPSMVEHIARHDPARVLAECEARRRIVKFHESWPVLVETPPEFEPSDPTDLRSMTFRVSQQIAWMTAQQYRERFGDESPAGPVLRALASVYADHPDFREEWRA